MPINLQPPETPPTPNSACVTTVVPVFNEATTIGAMLRSVLEHIQEDERELAHYQGLLGGAHGQLCLFVPARQGIYAPIDADFGHHRRYTRTELKSKLANAGFELTRLNYFNWVGYFAWALSFRLLKQRRFDMPAIRFFDRLIFPGVYWCESRLCPPPLGESLIAVARAR